MPPPYLRLRLLLPPPRSQLQVFSWLRWWLLPTVVVASTTPQPTASYGGGCFHHPAANCFYGGGCFHHPAAAATVAENRLPHMADSDGQRLEGPGFDTTPGLRLSDANTATAGAAAAGGGAISPMPAARFGGERLGRGPHGRNGGCTHVHVCTQNILRPGQ